MIEFEFEIPEIVGLVKMNLPRSPVSISERWNDGVPKLEDGFEPEKSNPKFFNGVPLIDRV